MSILIGIYPEWVWLVCWKVNHVLTCLNFEFAQFGSVVNSVLYCEYTGTITPIPSSFPKLMHDCLFPLSLFLFSVQTCEIAVNKKPVCGYGMWFLAQLSCGRRNRVGGLGCSARGGCAEHILYISVSLYAEAVG